MKSFKKGYSIFFSVLCVSLFSLISCGTKEYSVTFDSNGGDEVPARVVAASTILNAESIPVFQDTVGTDDLKTGLHFAGWYDQEDKLLEPGYIVTKDVLFTAKWIDRVVIGNSNYSKFNEKENMLKYCGKQLYIYAESDFSADNFHAVFFDGKYQNFKTYNSNYTETYYIQAILDLSDTTVSRFYYVCDNVQKLILSKSCSQTDVFNADILEEIVIPEENNYLTAIDGIMYNKAGTKILGYPRGHKAEKLVLPETLTSLSTSSINQPTTKATKELVVHDKFTQFGDTSFYRFTALEKVTFKGTTPPVMAFNESSDFATFKECSENIKFYVPKGSKNAYVTSDSWVKWYAKAGYAGELADRIIEY